MRKFNPLSLAAVLQVENPEEAILICKDATLTRESEAAACDINNIMRKFERTGVLDHVMAMQGQYGDAYAVGSFFENAQRVAEVQSAFEQLPAKVRSFFNHDAGAAMDYIYNPDNIPEMVKMGWLEPTEASVLKASTPAKPLDAAPAASPSPSEGANK